MQLKSYQSQQCQNGNFLEVGIFLQTFCQLRERYLFLHGFYVHQTELTSGIFSKNSTNRLRFLNNLLIYMKFLIIKHIKSYLKNSTNRVINFSNPPKNTT